MAPRRDHAQLVENAKYLAREEGLSGPAMAERFGMRYGTFKSILLRAGVNLSEIRSRNTGAAGAMRITDPSTGDGAGRGSSTAPTAVAGDLSPKYSSEEAAAIQAALAAGKVRRVESGDWPDASRPALIANPVVRARTINAERRRQKAEA